MKNKNKIMLMMESKLILTITKESMLMMMLGKSTSAQRLELISSQRICAEGFTPLLTRENLLN